MFELGKYRAKTIAASRQESRLIAYATGNFGKNLVWTAADVTLLFLLTDRLGMTPAARGTLMLIAFAGDMLLDLAIGMLVARATERGSSYRYFILAGMVPCGTAFGLLYALPWLEEKHFWVLAITLLVFRGSYAVIDVPHNAMLASIARDSRARGRAAGYRLFFSTVASLMIATILTPLIEAPATQGLPRSLALLGIGAALLFFLAMGISARLSPTASGRGGVNMHRRSTRTMPRFDSLTAAMATMALLTGFAIPMFGRTMIYVTTYVLERPGFAGTILAAITFGQFPGVILWTSLVRYFEKTTLLAAGHLVSIIGMFLFVLAGKDTGLLLTSAALVGLGFASVLCCRGAFWPTPWILRSFAIGNATKRGRLPPFSSSSRQPVRHRSVSSAGRSRCWDTYPSRAAGGGADRDHGAGLRRADRRKPVVDRDPRPDVDQPQAACPDPGSIGQAQLTDRECVDNGEKPR